MDVTTQWPALPYDEFQDTGYFLHRCVQVIGKLKLTTPFEPHWANVPLWLTTRGLTTGPISYKGDAFSIDIDFFDHQIIFVTGTTVEKLKLTSMSVAEFTEKFLKTLHKLNIQLSINLMPQEIPNPIALDKDTQQRTYNPTLAYTWWRILLSTYFVLERYHARFDGETPPIGLMWGTFDIRDARYNGVPVPTTGINAEYIRRNAMDEAQIEVGWWSGNPQYTRAAYYSFTYPQPEKIELAKIKPEKARWDKTLSLFVLDYDDLRQAKDPTNELFDFFESTYQVGANLGGWDSKLIVSGEPK